MGRHRKELRRKTAEASGPVLGETSEDILTLQGKKALARRKGLSLRTLHRRLSEFGLEASAIQDANKRKSILALLATELPLKDVASRLALSGPQSLNRLVRRLFGATPNEVRERIR